MKIWVVILLLPGVVFSRKIALKAVKKENSMVKSYVQADLDLLHKYYQTARRFSRTLDLSTLMREVLRSLKELEPVSAGSLWFKKNGQIQCVESFGKAASQIKGRTLNSDEGIVGWVVANKIYTFAESYKDGRHASYVEEEVGFESKTILCFPLVAGRRCFGAVEIIDSRHSKEELRVDKKYLNLLQEIIDIASIALSNAINHHNLIEDNEEKEKQNQLLKERLNLFERPENIIGESKALQEIFYLVNKYAPSPYNVLIYGESGTGKELIAKAIHDRSKRKDEPFVAENCAAIPETLLESELFGFMKGAFTDAKQNKKGLFLVANGGTLFLDEIGSMPSALQTKILRVIQDGKVKPLGSTKDFEVDVRIIAASNQDLKKAVEENIFRDDLFYRLNVLPIHLPPLRERKEDIPLLLKFFLERECKVININLKRVSKGVLDVFSDYHWPGNIRELENLVRQLIVTAGNKSVISENDLPDYLFLAKRQPGSEDRNPGGELGSRILSQGIVPWDDFLRQYITGVLEECRWNVTRAAKCLKLNRSTLFSKMRKLGIKR